ncbi:hypothetical protein FZ934_17495 [Rhizobium grahamii]|uniref:Uncharacterized protein n=1 Tax=Rhizobium grahamii TaxID=1120045 RepID=A0A5Q0CDM6_9HYPH|nr:MULTISPECIES: hypothetical protein [Rhizobium]QFY62031.1 hypothetical protein FZ934_17495 [Rhizobium grahamii]QRM48792.1 hypothetical protein F3Y33_05400 [Rhizobium sp. BG6]
MDLNPPCATACGGFFNGGLRNHGNGRQLMSAHRARTENDQHYPGLENGGQGGRRHLQLIASQTKQYSIDLFEFLSKFCVTSISFNTIPFHRISPLVAG